MALSTVWYLGPEPVTPHNGATWLVPGSHRDVRNPRGPDDGIDERSPIPGEFQLAAPPGSVLIQDSRMWHCNARNRSSETRHSIVLRLAPWWLSCAEFGGRARECVTVPREVYDRMPRATQLLYRHVAEGVDDFLQPANQVHAQRARFLDQPALRAETLGDNSHIVVRVPAEEEARRARL
jgi:ectoine hydroxylase-related dioxygenase (phytanoyl-CoA dioxygenase family)